MSDLAELKGTTDKEIAVGPSFFQYRAFPDVLRENLGLSITVIINNIYLGKKHLELRTVT